MKLYLLVVFMVLGVGNAFLYAQDEPVTVAPEQEEEAPLCCIRTVEFVCLKLTKDQAQSLAIQFEEMEKEGKTRYAKLFLNKEQKEALQKTLGIEEVKQVVYVDPEGRHKCKGATYWTFPKCAAKKILCKKSECPPDCKCECPEDCKCEKRQKAECPEDCKCEKCQGGECPPDCKCKKCQKGCGKCEKKCGECPGESK